MVLRQVQETTEEFMFLINKLTFIMKKNNFFKFIGALVITLSVTSCVEDKETYASNINSKPTVSLASNTFTVNEGEVASITLTADRAYKSTMDFNLEILSGATATPEDDYAVDLDKTEFGTDPWNGIDGYLVSFPANQTSYTIPIATILDDVVEGTESITFKLTVSGNHNGVIKESSRVFTVNILNKAQDKLTLTFDWEKNFDFGGATYSLCDLVYDNDFYLVSGATIVSSAATANCPETLELDITELANGNYDIYQNLYDDGGVSGAGISPAFSIPVRVNYNRPGSATLSGTYTQSSVYAVDSNATSDPNFDAPIYVVSVNVTNGVFTLFDDNGNIASGRSSQVKNLIKNFKAKNAKKK